MLENKPFELNIEDIVPPYLMLRLVERRSLDYMELRDSILAHGVLNSILVRKSSRLEGKYEIIDGTYRFTCAKDIGMSKLPAILVSAEDEEALLMQVQCNMQRPPTRRTEYAMHLKRLFAADPDLTFEELSVRLNKNPCWIKSTLKLARLSAQTKKELDAGNIPLVTAYAMCRLPQRVQDEFLPQALCLSGREASELCVSVAKEYIEHLLQGKSEKFYSNPEVPRPNLRTLRTIVDEYEAPLCGSVILGGLEITPTPIEAWKMALAWVLHMDSDSLQKHAERHAIKMEEAENQLVERRSRRAVLKEQAELGLDWRYPLIDD